MKKICILQHDSNDCAAACIAMISQYYKLKISISKIRELASTSLVGTNVLGIKQAGEKLGFKVDAVRAEEKEFTKDLSFPLIAHVIKDNLLHYVVVYGIKKNKIIVADPAIGLEKIEFKEFINKWSGILIFFTPSETFKKVNEKKGLFERYFFLIKPNQKLIWHIITATLINTFLGVVGSFYFKFLIDDILANKLKNTLIAFSVGIILIKIFGLILSSFRQYMVLILSQKINSDLMLKYYNHVLNLPLSFFEKKQVGEITSRMGDAGTIIGAMSNIIFSIMIDSLMVVIVGSILFVQNLKLFLCILIFIPLYILTSFIFIKPFRNYSRKIMESGAQLNSFLLESLNGIVTIKSLSAEEHANLKYENLFINLLEKDFILKKIGMLSSFLDSILDILSSNFILLFGSLEVINGRLTIGELLTFNALFGYFFDPIQNFIDLIPSTQSAYVASDRLGEVLDVDSEYDNESKKLSEINGDIHFNNVNFKYDNRKEILKKLSFDIKAGQKVAFVGESGSGKSTIVKLIMNYYTAEDGNIKINNHNITDIDLKVLRKKIAYIPQNNFLFSGTLYDNLKFGFPDITHEEIVEVCNKVKLTDLIETNPQRYNLMIGENGNTLSGGQKQRIALARMILKKDADIIILDEATCNLDVSTEQEILDLIKEISVNKTLIVVAHRVSTIKNFDNIIVLSDGEIIEEGKHSELLKLEKGTYKKLWSLQTTGETNE